MSNEMLAMAKEALGMFVFLATELTILFIVISYLVGVLQLFITPEKIQSILSSKNGKGYVVAALLGAITPFCSCSTIPFLKGLLIARAGFGPMMVFLFGSPLLNPVIIGLFVITFGWQVALFYFLVALVVSVIAGYTLEKLGFERYVKPEAYSIKAVSSCAESSCSEPKALEPKKTQPNRWIKVWRATFKDFKQVFPYLMLGVAIGSFIYGFIPTELIAKYAGDGMWYAIPIAAIIGIPLYIRAEAVIPLSAALVKKGMALGSVMALIIGSAGASLTEVILLKSIFKNQMIAAFLFVIITMAIGAGFLYKAIF
ncbi:permease [Pseudoalteromonas sp. SWYJZ12]|uniref:permease n=1 Tax=Pseudoalteromonas sp. SWYJZ12 TaxID=2792067 RepID=UPI0018CF971C|nr:permease [Pseudoalteromonas sp. SWYJZ12]MBH0003941.1 permease [Pseudoalteromonas sp. SWYJZ12]